MAALPAFCPKCRSIFPFHGIGIGAGATVGISDVGTNCPVCGFQHAKISDGVYRATQDAIHLISGPESTREILEFLKRLAEGVSSGEIDRERAAKQAQALPPKYAALFNAFVTIGMPALALLVQIISVYLQIDSNRSSGEDAKKLLDAVTEQTFTLKQIQKRGVGPESGAPPNEKAKLKPSGTKDPPGRRADVNKQRRAALKKYREAFGQSRTR
jgi:hypothetical protein